MTTKHPQEAREGGEIDPATLREFETLCPAIYTDPERELLWKGFQLARQHQDSKPTDLSKRLRKVYDDTLAFDSKLLIAAADEIERLAAAQAVPGDEVRDKIARAYGYLWHVNAATDAPVEVLPPSVTPEQAAYTARKLLRDLLTHEQRGKGINAARETMFAATNTEGEEQQ